MGDSGTSGVGVWVTVLARSSDELGSVAFSAAVESADSGVEDSAGEPATDESDDSEPEVESDDVEAEASASEGSAPATPCPVATAAPNPRASANTPTGDR